MTTKFVFSRLSLLFIALLLPVSLSITLVHTTAFAHSHGDKKADHKTHKHQHHKKETKAKSGSLSIEQAIAKLDQGIIAMAKTMSPEKREEMFDNGPIMHEWHTHTNAIEDAIAALETHAKQKSETEQKYIEQSLEQIEDILADFHVATHDRKTEDALSEVKKATETLKKIKSHF